MTTRRSRALSFAAGLTAAAASLGATAGCGIIPGGGDAPLDVAGAAVEVESGRVVSECFAFDLPEDMVLQDGSEASACRADLNIADGTALTMVMARAQAGGANASQIEESFRNAGVTQPLEPVTVDGHPGWRVETENAFGLPTVFVVIPLEPGAFAEDGAALESIIVAGPSADMFGLAIDEVLATMEIRDGS